MAALLEEAAGAGTWSLCAGGRHLQASPRMALLLGLEPGASPVDFSFVAEPWREEVESLVRRCVRQGLGFDHEVQVLVRGRRLWARLLGQASRAEGSAVAAQGPIDRVEGVLQVIEPHAARAGAIMTLDP